VVAWVFWVVARAFLQYVFARVWVVAWVVPRGFLVVVKVLMCGCLCVQCGSN